MELVSENKHQMLSKIATSDQHGENSPYFDGWKAYDNDPFHLTGNPNGVIQMGLAENQLSFDLIEEWIRKNPQASICTDQGANFFKYIANFQDYHGLPEFRNAIAKFMGRARGDRVKFDPDRIVMSGGATGATELLMFCLAEPGDAFLIPTPYYPAFDRDLCWRTGVKLLPVTCHSHNNFQITIEALEAAYEKAIEANIKVKGLILANPSNPLGTILDKPTLTSVVNFINRKNIHLVCDEIYGATIFKKPQFLSISEVIQEMDCNQELIHVVYSLSKDLGMPGFRVGIVYSYNDNVVSTGRKMSSFCLVSSQTQYFLSYLLSDDDFVDSFLKESANRLANRHKHFTNGLEEVGIKCLDSNAGLFCWMDLRPLMKDQTTNAEMSLWRVIINDVKLNVSPGISFHCSEPGWFRVCFANIDDATVDIALTRIHNFVAKNKEAGHSGKRKQWQMNLRLSFSSRVYDDSLISPHLSSPRSPLVRART